MSKRKKWIGATLAALAAAAGTAYAWGLPAAVRAGWFSGSIERELGDLTGTPAHVGGAELPSPRRLVLHDVTIESIHPALKTFHVETVRLDLDGAFPWGRPVAVELVRPSVALYPELWKRQGQEAVTIPPELCRKLRNLPAVRITDAQIEIHTTEDLERISKLDGRIESGPTSLRLNGRGAVAGGPVGSFAVDGSLDLESGKPTLQVATIQPALPAALRRLLASVLDVRIDDLRVRQSVNLDRGLVEKTEMAMEPTRLSARILSRGRDPIEAFGLRMDVLETTMDLSGQFNGIRLPLGNGGVAELTAAFTLRRGENGNYDGVARLLADFYARDGDAEPAERADLLMEDLAIRAVPASVSFHGSIQFADGRLLEIAGFDASEKRARLVGSLRGWSIEAQPWTLASMKPPGIEGAVDADFDVKWENDAWSGDLGFRTDGLRHGDAVSFSTKEPLKVNVRNDCWEAHGTLNDVTVAKMAPMQVAVDFAGTKQKDGLVGSLTVAADTSRLAVEAAVNLSAPSVRGYGTLTASDGPSIDVSAFEVARENEKWNLSLAGAAKAWDLARPWPLLWRVIGIEAPALRGVVDLGGNVARRGDELTVDVSIESPGGWSARWGTTEARFKSARVRWTPILAGAARALEIDVPEGVAISAVPLDVEIGPIRVDGRWTHGVSDEFYIFQDLKLAVQGVQALRDTAYFDGRADPLTLTTSGTYDCLRHHLKLDAAALAMGTWGRATLTGEVEDLFGAFRPTLEIRAEEWPLEKLLAAAGLAVDLSGLAGRGSVSGEWRIEPDGGRGTVRAALDEVAFRNYRMKGVKAEIPLLYGRPGEATGTVSYEDFEYPGGATGGSGAEFTLVRRGAMDFEVKLAGAVAGKFCGGRVAADAFRLRAHPEGGLEGEASVRADGVDLTMFSELAGLEKPIRGAVSGRFDRTTFSESNILFSGEGLRGGAFEGDWALSEVRIDDPFGPMTSYAFTAAYDRVNLKSFLEYLNGYGILQGSVAGSAQVEIFHTGEPTFFEVDVHDVPKAGLQKALNRRAVSEMIASFNSTERGRTIAQYVATLPDVPEYDRLGLYARLDRDHRLTIRGRYYCDADETTWGAYSLSELRSNIVREGAVEYLLVGAGKHRVDVVQRTPAARPRLERVLERLKRVKVEGGD